MDTKHSTSLLCHKSRREARTTQLTLWIVQVETWPNASHRSIIHSPPCADRVPNYCSLGFRTNRTTVPVPVTDLAPGILYQLRLILQSTSQRVRLRLFAEQTVRTVGTLSTVQVHRTLEVEHFIINVNISLSALYHILSPLLSSN